MSQKDKFRKKIISKSEKETIGFAIEFAEKCKKDNINVICLKGNLGAGKTVFTKGFAQVFGVDPAIVKSPTYTYFRTYNGINNKVYHFDYYRLTKPDTLAIEELNEIIDKSDCPVLIEWPEIIEDCLPKKRSEVLINYGNGLNERYIEINRNKNE